MINVAGHYHCWAGSSPPCASRKESLQEHRRFIMGDKSPKNTKKQQTVHDKKKEAQKKKPAESSKK